MQQSWLHIKLGRVKVQLKDLCFRQLPEICSALADKLFVALVALLAPEFIFAWALRQRLTAGRLAKECRKAASEPAAAEARLRRRRNEYNPQEPRSLESTRSGGSGVGVDSHDGELVPMLAVTCARHDESTSNVSSQTSAPRRLGGWDADSMVVHPPSGSSLDETCKLIWQVPDLLRSSC